MYIFEVIVKGSVPILKKKTEFYYIWTLLSEMAERIQLTYTKPSISLGLAVLLF